MNTTTSELWRKLSFDAKWRRYCYFAKSQNSIMAIRLFQGKLFELLEEALTQPFANK